MTDKELEELLDNYLIAKSAIEEKDYTKAITILEPIVIEIGQKGVDTPISSSMESFFFKITNNTEQEGKWLTDIRLLICLSLIKSYIELADDSKAIKVLELVIQFWQDFAPAYRELGKLYLKQQKLKDAYRCFRDAIKHGNADAEVYQTLTFISCELKLYNEAIKYGEQALRLDQNNTDTYKDLFVAYNETKQSDKAMQMLALIIKINATNYIAPP